MITINGIRIVIGYDDPARGAAFFYATSPDVRGLLVSRPTKAELIEAIPSALADLKAAEADDWRAIPRAQYEAYDMAAKALDQCVSDFNAFPDGKCVCQQAKEEAIEALAALRAAGCLEDGE